VVGDYLVRGIRPIRNWRRHGRYGRALNLFNF
jgi:hypothetical protein